MREISNLLSIAFPVEGSELTVAVAEPDVKALLVEHGVAVPKGRVVPAVADVRTAASDLSPPLAVKAFAAGLIHKSDKGAVELNITSGEAAEAAAGRIAGRLTSHGLAAAGFLVEEQQPAGLEMILGVIDRPPFGLTMAVGIGGVLTEILDDMVLRPVPVDAADA